jgi:SAM-dependent methyltransferase
MRVRGLQDAPPMPCPVCDSAETEAFLRRDDVPVHQNSVFNTPEAALRIARGDLAMTVCRQCGFVFNARFDAGRLSYESGYDNNQLHSPAFRCYVDDLARRLVDVEGVRGCRIVDVGCGNGDFLRSLVHDPETRNSGTGFDPAYRGPDCDCGGRARFVRDYFGAPGEQVRADVVVCRHVIEHIADPVALLRSVRAALDGSPGARVYFETPDVGWILRNGVIWDFFYEHCSLFAPGSLSTGFARAGFHVEHVRRVFCDQYLWLEAVVADAEAPSHYDSAGLPELARRYAEREADTLLHWDHELDRLSATGPVALWGAGAQGVTFANLIDPRRERIDCVVDLNPNKQGRFLPGTAHPIVGFHALADRGVKSAILMNPNYLAENRRLLAEAGLELELIGQPD